MNANTVSWINLNDKCVNQQFDSRLSFMLLISLYFLLCAVLGETSNSYYLYCANMVAILYIDIVVPTFWEDNDTHGDTPWVECYWQWLCFLFYFLLLFYLQPVESSPNSWYLELFKQEVRTHMQGWL